MTAMSLTTSFGTRMVIRNPRVTDHEWGPTIEGWAMVEDSLIEEWVIVRLQLGDQRAVVAQPRRSSGCPMKGDAMAYRFPLPAETLGWSALWRALRRAWSQLGR